MTSTFQDGIQTLAHQLLNAEPIHTGEWHAMNTSASPVHATHECVNVTVQYPIPQQTDTLANEIKPNLPWADEHFAERVSGIPYNPPPSHVRWPWARHNAKHQDGTTRFSHTYPERFWPRYDWNRPNEGTLPGVQREGIRYRYGDLSDVVDLLVRKPFTRQAFLPVWFPEDTGATSGQRVPCTLGYHFLVRHGVLNVVYFIRSCDFIRHFNDDVYLACRLAQWVCGQICSHYGPANDDGETGDVVTPGLLTMHISSLHAMVGDQFRLAQLASGFREDCERCQTDNHRCPGCGTPTSHARTACPSCYDIP